MGHLICYVVIIGCLISEASSYENIEEFLYSLSSFTERLFQSFMSNDVNGLQYHRRKLEEFIDVLSAVLAIISVENGMEFIIDLIDLLIRNLRGHLRDINHKLSHATQNQRPSQVRPSRYFCETQVVECGRPKYVIKSEQILSLRETGMMWKDIAKCLNISAKTLYRHRRELRIPESFTNIDSADLLLIIQEILTLTPNAGESYVMGSLRGRGVIIPRQRLRENLMILDPVGRAVRKHKAIIRRVYNVVGANHLWHIDSNHKLIAWRFVIHGCVDGFSRANVYLNCANNNLAETALGYFRKGVENFGLPLRARGDRGVENVDIARFMIENRGINKGSFIVGRSVHNTRIERLWSDVNRVVLSYYHEIFKFMENAAILDEHSELHIFALCFVFLPRINRSLQEFRSQLNYHGLSSAPNRKSPLALWHESMLTIEEDIFVDDIDQYGVDYEDNFAEILEPSGIITVPDTTYEISEETSAQINQQFSPLLDDGNHGINSYCNLVDYLHSVS